MFKKNQQDSHVSIDYDTVNGLDELSTLMDIYSTSADCEKPELYEGKGCQDAKAGNKQ